MTDGDYDAVYALWKTTPGIGLSEADERRNIAVFLEYNRGLSFVAEAGGAIAGAVLGSFDGRRGYLHHLAVAPGFRRSGIGRTLVERCLADAEDLGLQRVFALTYRPAFFAMLGFHAIEKSELPHKVWQDCVHCPKFPDCDEVAVLREVLGRGRVLGEAA